MEPGSELAERKRGCKCLSASTRSGDVYTGNALVDELIEASNGVLFYGVAGAGKTTILLTVAGNLCWKHPCVYVTTEETVHYERVARNPSRYERALFTEAYDMASMVKIAQAIAMIKPRYVFVDSLNSPFRLEALKENTLASYGFVIATLLSVAESVEGKLFASAQVRAGEAGEIEISGFKILDYYFDTIFEVSIEDVGTRAVKPLKSQAQPRFEKLFFRITDEGVEWFDRPH